MIHYEAAGLDLLDSLAWRGNSRPQILTWEEAKADGMDRQAFEKHRRDYFSFYITDRGYDLEDRIRQHFNCPDLQIQKWPLCGEYEMTRKPAEEKSELQQGIDLAKSLLAKMPSWKRNQLVLSSSSTNPVPRKPVVKD